MKLILYTLLASSLFATTKKENRGGHPELMSNQNCESYYDSTFRQKVYTRVTTQPTFGNGERDLFRFILKTITYPSARDVRDADSKAIAEFVIDSEGKMHAARIVDKEVGEYSPLDRSLLEVIKKMPQQWHPGNCEGINVAYLYRLPMRVCLSR